MRMIFAAMMICLAFATPVYAKCNCSLTFMAVLQPNRVSVFDLYSLPYHCAKGPFHVDQDKRVVHISWLKVHEIHTVLISLPAYPINGTFQVNYCWGWWTAIVGNEELPVQLEVLPIGLA